MMPGKSNPWLLPEDNCEVAGISVVERWREMISVHLRRWSIQVEMRTGFGNQWHFRLFPVVKEGDRNG